MKLYLSLTIALLLIAGAISGLKSQPVTIDDNFLSIRAGAGDPLYTTYAAAMVRSRLYGDKAYKMDYYSQCLPVSYSSDQSGKIYNIWKINDVVVDKISEFHQPPVVTASFPDMAVMTYEPWPGIEVQETFLVYSSKTSVVRMWITNNTDKPHEVDVYPTINLDKDSIHIQSWDHQNHAYHTHRHESLKRLISNLYSKAGYPTEVMDIFTGNFTPYSYGGYFGNMDDFYNIVKTDFYTEDRSDSLNMASEGFARFIALHGRFNLQPGESADIRYIRGIQDQKEDVQELIEEINDVKTMDLQPFADANIALFKSVPRLDFKSEDERLVYLGALNLARGCMLPPSGQTSHNFYVFSREPLWGWGHGHQVLHESLAMLAYALLDAESAQESQRVYMEQQGDDGLIAYRHGPRGPQTYPHKGQPTTSAPFYSWINWEVYGVSGDRDFLEDAYISGSKYVDWLHENRDTDDDGTFEWGPYGIIENVRD
ncbi:MAG: hypothetical protein ACLFPE_05660, partial [Bacteroidales bacterium]